MFLGHTLQSQERIYLCVVGLWVVVITLATPLRILKPSYREHLSLGLKTKDNYKVADVLS